MTEELNEEITTEISEEGYIFVTVPRSVLDVFTPAIDYQVIENEDRSLTYFLRLLLDKKAEPDTYIEVNTLVDS
jgi:hypothetical protein